VVLTKEAIEYSIRQLARITGLESYQEKYPFKKIGINIIYGIPESKLETNKTIYINPCNIENWEEIVKLPPQKVQWINKERFIPSINQKVNFNSLPILFWGKDYRNHSKPIVEVINDNAIIFKVDILSTILFMLSRWEETIKIKKDRYGRFPADLSLAYKNSFLDRPIIDEYVIVFVFWLQRLLPQWNPIPKKPLILLTHDIDHIQEFSNPIKILKPYMKSILVKNDYRSFIEISKSIIQEKNSLVNSRYFKAIYQLSQLSKEFGFRNIIFFQATSHDRYDSGYEIERKEIKVLLSDLIKNGSEIGLHASFYSYNNLERLLCEKSRLEKVIDTPIKIARQHYLRFNVPETWEIHEKAGIVYDSTLSYAQCEGFRCGTCKPFKPFDFIQNRELNILEIPLIVMDTSLKNYRHLSVNKAENVIMSLAQKCKNVEGLFTILWHNTSIIGDWSEWGKMYKNSLINLQKNF
jgi:hypothetical protein